MDNVRNKMQEENNLPAIPLSPIQEESSTPGNQGIAPVPDENVTIVDRFQLYLLLLEHFTHHEIELVALRLQVDPGNLMGDNKSALALELVRHCERVGLLSDLANLIRQMKPEGVGNIHINVRYLPRDSLVNALVSSFNRNELNVLCFSLGINDEDLPGESLTEKALGMVKYLVRRDRISDLIEQVSQFRPNVDWHGLIRETKEVLIKDSPNSSERIPGENKEPQTTSPKARHIQHQQGLFTWSRRLAHFVSEIKQITDNMSAIKPGDFQKIAASQIELLSSFYLLVVDQARQSFRWAIIAAAIGLAFFIIGVTTLLSRESIDIAVVSIISGSLVQVIAGINFYLYNRATAQLKEFHMRLELTQKFLLGNSICEGLEGDFKQSARSELIRVMIGANVPVSDQVKALTDKKSEENGHAVIPAALTLKPPE
jgi:hypothetical protein